MTAPHFTADHPRRPGFFSSAPRYPQFWLALLPLALLVWVFWSGPSILGAPEDEYTADIYQQLDPNAYCSALMPASARAYQQEQRLAARQQAWQQAHQGRDDYPPHLRSRPNADLKCQAGYIAYSGCKHMGPTDEAWALCEQEGFGKAQHRFDCTTDPAQRKRCDEVFDQLDGTGEVSLSGGSSDDYRRLGSSSAASMFSRKADLCALQEQLTELCHRQEYADDQQGEVQLKAGLLGASVGMALLFCLIWYVVDYQMFIRKYGQTMPGPGNSRGGVDKSGTGEYPAPGYGSATGSGVLYERSSGHRMTSWLVAVGVVGALGAALFVLWILSVVFAPAGSYS